LDSTITGISNGSLSLSAESAHNAPPAAGSQSDVLTPDPRQALSAEAKTMRGRTYKAIVGQPDRNGILNFDDAVVKL
jgi:hypothetical protein